MYAIRSYYADNARSANRRLYIPDQCLPALNRNVYNLYGFRLACDFFLNKRGKSFLIGGRVKMFAVKVFDMENKVIVVRLV